MGEKILMKGNEAIAEAAIRAGCRFFFGYPITPQNEIPAYMARRLPEVGGTFLQAESEIGAINMVFGASGSGARVMTSSSGPGISLKQEGISYIAGAELPCVIVNISRGGPGLGNLGPTQSDYFQATRGGGHGDYRTIVLGPSSIQEAVELVDLAFELADKYRTPVVILGDTILGQMMEPVEFKDRSEKKLPEKPWATTGAKGRKKNVIKALNIVLEELEELNRKLQEKYREIAKNEAKAEKINLDRAQLVIAAYGTAARISRTSLRILKEKGIEAGMIRPITLWPFPHSAFDEVAGREVPFLTVELNAGQMVDDVRLAVNGRAPVYFHGRMGGMVPTPEEIVEKCLELLDS